MYRLLIYTDSTCSFSKIDERIVDYLPMRWTLRNDTMITYMKDSLQLVMFMFYMEDSIHRRITHIDPLLYKTYNGEFPPCFYLSNVYYDNGKIWKRFEFNQLDKNGDPKNFERTEFNRYGQLLSITTFRIASGKAYYNEYYPSTGYPRIACSGYYVKGIPKGKWKYYDEKSGHLTRREKPVPAN